MRFSTNEGRMKHKQEIDGLISQETLRWDNQELMKILQTAGVPAGAVLDGQELLFNEHLKSRDFYEMVPHHPTTGMPPLPYAGRPWKFSTTTQVVPKAAPIMGEHNKSIFIDLLGYDESLLEEWESEGIIGYGPTSPISVQRPSLEEQVRQGRLQRFEPDFLNQVSDFHQGRR